MAQYLMVLNDGSTFSRLEGCAIIKVPDDWDGEYLEDYEGNPLKAAVLLDKEFIELISEWL